MRLLASLVGAAWLGGASIAAAMPYMGVPEQVQFAPIDRALANVAAMKDAPPGERARLQGRLNLLAYMRNNDKFAYRVGDGGLNEAGIRPCSDMYDPRARTENEPPRFTPDQFCANPNYDIGPRNEIPDDGKAPPKPNAEALKRLTDAANNYAEALQAEPDNLRSHLGYAYALDRLGRMEEARAHLRTIIKLGLPKVSGPTSEWEDHAVLTEAVTHLSLIAKSRADKARVAKLKARLAASQPMIYVTPMVVPLTDAPFAALTDPASPVAFDFTGTGDKRANGWLKRDAAWLVWDPRGKGKIKSGFDLIGAATWAGFWRDGFQVLRALDDDHDGKLAGAELSGLALWRDANSNGVSDAGEVKPVTFYEITALDTHGAGDPDLLVAPGGVRFKNGATRPLYDWTPKPLAKKPVS